MLAYENAADAYIAVAKKQQKNKTQKVNADNLITALQQDGPSTIKFEISPTHCQASTTANSRTYWKRIKDSLKTQELVQLT